MRGMGADRLVVAPKPGNAGGAKGTGHPGESGGQPGRPGRNRADEPTSKPFVIEASGRVGGVSTGQGKPGGGGVDRQSAPGLRAGPLGEPVQDLEPDELGDLLPAAGARRWRYRRRGAGTRVFGVPTVADRIAQTVAAMALEPSVEPMFHPDSYGYRPGRSAIDAVRVCRERCWRDDWVIDLDLQVVLRHDPARPAATRGGTPPRHDRRWVLLYVQRWLVAPLQRDGRQPGRAGSRQPAGLGDLPAARQPLPALRVRHVDGSGRSRHGQIVQPPPEP